MNREVINVTTRKTMDLPQADLSVLETDPKGHIEQAVAAAALYWLSEHAKQVVMETVL